MRQRFEEACAASPHEVCEAAFSVGGVPVHARIAGRELAAVLQRSLVAQPDAGAGLRLELWDQRATGVPGKRLSRQDAPPERHGPAGERLSFDTATRNVHFWGPDFDIHLDRARQHAVGWVSAVGRLSSWHRARPLQTLLLAWLGGRGRVVVHASTVARDGCGVLLAGPALSGKSTAAASCAAAGFDLLGDETIALELHDGRLHAHTVHAAIKLRGDSLSRHPALADRAQACESPWPDDRVVFLNDALPEQVARSARIVALGFPTISHERHTVAEPLRRGAALRILTGCVLSLEPGNVGASFEAIHAVTARVPAYRLGIGGDTPRIPDAIEALLSEAAAAKVTPRPSASPAVRQPEAADRTPAAPPCP